MKIKIIKAKKENYKEVGFLFDLYRQFYKYKTEIKKSTKYIKERISKKESTIFLCYCDKEPAGFVQLYETFDSLNINKKLILYDLYVKKEFVGGCDIIREMHESGELTQYFKEAGISK